MVGILGLCQFVDGVVPFVGFPCERVGGRVEDTRDCMNISGAW
jgi:hypothetical protein